MSARPSRRHLVLGAAGGFALLPSRPAEAAASDDPAETVKALYAKPQRAPDAPFMSARLRRLFADQRARARRAGEAMAGLDFDYACGCQDYDEGFKKTLRYTVKQRDDRRATVVATFTLFDAQKDIEYSLARENGRWLIDDISGRTGEEAWSMASLLRMR